MCPELLLRQPYTSKVVSPPYVHILSVAVKLIMTLFLVPLFCNAHQRQWAGKPGGRVGRGSDFALDVDCQATVGCNHRVTGGK